jgi:hypothetical protein
VILVNFSHPLNDDQRGALEAQIGQPIVRLIATPAQFDPQVDFVSQLKALMTSIPLSADEWQSEAILVNPPSLNFIAVLILAELHGRMGYFPPVIRLRPVKDALPPRYEVAEILNLQAVRDTARTRRQ